MIFCPMTEVSIASLAWARSIRTQTETAIADTAIALRQNMKTQLISFESEVIFVLFRNSVSIVRHQGRIACELHFETDGLGDYTGPGAG